MLTTLVALIALVAFVLPGFIASRVASRDRPTPATLTDLELILRAIGYALVIHLALASTGWTACLVRKLDGGKNWGDHVWELALFALTLVASAVALGQLLYWAFDALAPRSGSLARLAFHAVGGQDVRDGYDYIFLRRKRQGQPFIVVVHAKDGERYAGVYGDASYFGFSPRPHDLYLEEMWDARGSDLVRPTDGETIGGWFRADVIDHLEFRELRKDEASQGSARRFGLGGIRGVLRELREAIANDFVAAAQADADVPADEELQNQVARLVALALETVNHSPTYEEGQTLRGELVRVGGLVTRMLRAEEDFDSDEILIRELRRAAERAHDTVPPWELWAMTLSFYVDRLDKTRDRDGDLTMVGGLIAEAIMVINEWDWGEIDQEREAQAGNAPEPDRDA